jgi:glutathione synthase/RimK-type ligase-like ATP-grasp enzyme
MILVVSSVRDTHAVAVMDGLARVGASASLLDLSRFPERMQLSISYLAGTATDHRLRDQDAAELALADCRVVWWRRPQSFQVHAEITNPAYRDFALSESEEAFAGLWLAHDAFWVNHPHRDQAAARKVYQLRVAREVGLEIPETLVTNSPEDARTFIRACGPERTIYKAFSATAQHWRETRLLKPEELELLESVKFAPLIFQTYIPARVDLRITMMGDHVFAGAIHSQETSYAVDFRMDMDAGRVEAFELPGPVVERLQKLMARLGLVYGAIDMRLTPDGRYVFLEINPAGQWLFVEQRTGQPMTEAFVRLLAAKDERIPGASPH